MKNLFLVISIIFIGINLGIAQTKSVDIKLSDFEFNSPYYKQDFIKKSDIHNYLSNQDIKDKDIRGILLNYCIDNGTNDSGDSTKKELKTKSDTIISMLNSLGSIIYCINEIHESGDIFYTVTRARNLNILIDKGVLRRN
ncbi:MAG TPA: hypothetical protein VFM82_05280 [Flavobacteriaceae bacterium]|nr:hypothetical protein [Flavobacteriaceae bacterium]